VRAVFLFVVAAALLGAALIARAPATLVDMRVAAATGDRLRLSDARGTIWEGAGTLRLGDSATGQPIAWRADPLSLFTGTVAVALGPASGQLRSTARVAPSRLELRQLDFIEVPVDALARSFAPGIPPPQGVLRIAIARLAIDATTISGQATLTWHGASLPEMAGGAPLRLGSVTAVLAERDGGLGGPLRGSGDDVESTGALTWHPSGVTSIDVTLTPRAGLPRERQAMVEATLARYGRPDGRGGYRITLPGSAG